MTAEQDERVGRRARRSVRAGATIDDVAQAAGVSRQTVTRAMNDMTGISALTKDRVLAAAKELNYRPSRFGRGLARATHDTIGLAVSDLANPYAPEFAAATVRYAGERGWNVVLVDIAHAKEPGRVLGDLATQVDAVIGYLGEPSVWADPLAGMTVVAVDPGEGQRPDGTRTVVLDPRPALRAAAAHLAAEGVRDVVVLDGDRDGRLSGRARTIAEALQEAGMRTEVLAAGGQDVESGRAAARTVVENGVPDAVFAWNDILAVGALATFAESGVAVPDRVRLVGIDGLSLGTFVSPQLTTLAVDMRAVAQHAVDLAIGALDPAGDDGPATHTVQHVFTPRGSA
jgi:DNA-binding LacI/PurR family transcriptional regulator